MILMKNEEKPLFSAYVNGILEKESANGGKFKSCILSTYETKKDETKEYSSWFCTLAGEAKRKFDESPLKKGDLIEVYGFKITNTSAKNPDGTFGKSYFNMVIHNYNIKGDKFAKTESSFSKIESEDEMPF